MKNIAPAIKTAVYPGSFDPITNGHVDVIRRALKVFDKIIIAVLENEKKAPLFTAKERIALIKQSVAEISDKIEVDSFSGLLVNYLRKKRTHIVVRGLRAMSDFDYEFQMAVINKSMDPEIETIFIATDRKYFYLNSTTVRELARWGGPTAELVPAAVEKALMEKFKTTK